MLRVLYALALRSIVAGQEGARCVGSTLQVHLSVGGLCHKGACGGGDERARACHSAIEDVQTQSTSCSRARPFGVTMVRLASHSPSCAAREYPTEIQLLITLHKGGGYGCIGLRPGGCQFPLLPGLPTRMHTSHSRTRSMQGQWRGLQGAVVLGIRCACTISPSGYSTRVSAGAAPPCGNAHACTSALTLGWDQVGTGKDGPAPPVDLRRNNLMEQLLRRCCRFWCRGR
jgi:hypothetical protein